MSKLVPDTSVRVDAYAVVARAVEEGASYGVRRAFKHTDKPEQNYIAQEVESAIMNALCEVLKFSED